MGQFTDPYLTVEPMVSLVHGFMKKIVTELSGSGAGDEVIRSIAGHVSRAMLSRYSHVRMEAKRRALDEIAARQNAAAEKRKAEAERREHGAVASQSAVHEKPPSRQVGQE